MMVTAPSASIFGQDRDSASMSRFLEAVQKAASEWYPPRGAPPVMTLAQRAVSRSSPQFVGGDAQSMLRSMVYIEAARQGRLESVVAEDSLRAFVNSLDPWSAYLDPVTWRQYQASQSASYCGVGMDLEKEDNDSPTCWPYPGSPAEAAGIKPGAKLLSVNNRLVKGLSIYAIGAMIRGPENREVLLSVANGFIPGVSKTVRVTRRRSHSRTVSPYIGRAGPGVKIVRFANDTAAELAAQLRSINADRVEIDLRGCRGGDLDSAVACAGIFLPTGTKVATILRKSETESLRVPAGQKLNQGILLLQNGDTASSAELFIRALTLNGIASSSGSRTKGKGTTQSIIPLSAGGALVLTTGLILDPGGRSSWHKTGLEPTN